MKIKIYIASIISFVVLASYAQAEMEQSKSSIDTGFSGELRNFYMNTQNLRSGLQDYQTNATSLLLSYNSSTHNNFSFHIGSRYITRLDNFDLNRMDDLTQKAAKWEYELYNVLQNDDFSILTLDEFYLQFKTKKLIAKAGNFYPKYTPFFNQSDGRMRPFAYRGVWTAYEHTKNHTFQLAWLTHALVRSTANWYSFSEAIGLFSQGFQPNGEVAKYANSIASNGAAILNYTYKKETFQLDFYQFYINQLFGISFAEMQYELGSWKSGLQYAYQVPTQNSDIPFQNRYIQPDENGQVISSKFEYQQSQQLQFAFAYSYSFATGRMLFPKELGRDWFYTSIARARMEGLGDTHAILLTGNYLFDKPNINLNFQFIQMHGPNQDNFRLNKYNIDEFWQLNAKLTYQVDFLKGLEFDALFIIRENFNNNDVDFVFNRSNFAQLNFVTKLYF